MMSNNEINSEKRAASRGLSMSIKTIVAIAKQRWKYFAVGYLAGYIFQIFGERAALSSFFPIKFMAIVFSLASGLVFWHAKDNLPMYKIWGKALVFGICMVVVLLLIFLLKCIIQWLFNYDIMILIGLSKPFWVA